MSEIEINIYKNLVSDLMRQIGELKRFLNQAEFRIHNLEEDIEFLIRVPKEKCPNCGSDIGHRDINIILDNINLRTCPVPDIEKTYSKHSTSHSEKNNGESP